MGCDIHLRAEFRESLPDRGDPVAIEAWLAGQAFGGPWQPAEPLVPNPFPDETPAATVVDYNERYYDDRCYGLFWVLSGVRGEYAGLYPLYEDRGAPEDLSDHVLEEWEAWGVDAHSEGYATLAELLEHDWVTIEEQIHSGFLDSIERLKTLAEKKCDGDASRVRVFWWYDN